MTVRIAPSRACGTVQAPPSKSMAHRLLLAAGLANGTSTVGNLAESNDVCATADCLAALGAAIRWQRGGAVVTGCNPAQRTDAVTLPCRESGSTLRFLLPLCLLSTEPATLIGTEKLLSRPLSVYEELCRARGLSYAQGRAFVTVAGPLTGGAFTIPGGISSQFVTGLLYALPLIGGGTVRLRPPVESRSYIDLTLDALQAFGVDAHWTDEWTLTVSGGPYRPADVTVEGDWSNVAFLEGLNLLGGDVTVTGLKEASRQGDRVYRARFAALAAGSPTIDLADCPDLGPVLFALAGALHGATFTNIQRLRLKESDRVAAMQTELRKLGVETAATETTLTVRPGLRAPTEPLFGHNDHRVVMAEALLLSAVGGVIEGAEAVAKSYPDFWEQYRTLGVDCDELDQQQ